MKHAVVLGAGVYQLPLFPKLAARGYHVTTISRDGDYPGFDRADSVFKCDIVDREAILEYCRSHGVDMIVTTGSDVGLPSIGLVNDRLGLPGIGFDSAKWSSSKQKMKDRFVAYEVRAARQRRLADYMEATPFRPFVAKLDVSSGSAGVFIIREPEDFAAFGLADKPDLILEDYIAGLEFGAQVVITDRVERIYIHTDETYMGSAPVPVGHGSHFADLPFDTADLIEQVERSQRALDMKDCIANYDFILNEDGCHILEVGARLGATGLAELIAHSHDVDLYDVAIDLARGDRAAVRARLGDGPMVAQPAQSVESYLLFSESDGRQITAAVADILRRHPDVISHELDKAPGTPVDRLRKGSDRFGMMVVRADPARPYEVSKSILAAIQDVI
ncbi:hypothetical protein [Oceaniglobus trochenteri]|uniref:hypothetical protein n=1 Tax=Oceaniglobus trochenteri TaxID=2763260 RepID=UPI001CFF9FAA|nr:hypothetical protein [Oceaniglobus trochenteri]